jgi:hypothetical protein
LGSKHGHRINHLEPAISTFANLDPFVVDGEEASRYPELYLRETTLYFSSIYSSMI